MNSISETYKRDQNILELVDILPSETERDYC